MNVAAYLYVSIYALLMGFWFVAQQKLYDIGVSRSTVLLLSGSGMALPIVISFCHLKKFPPTKSLKWFLGMGIAGVFLADCLVKATEQYGAALGSNAMGLGPVAAIAVGWIFLKEMPGKLGLIGIMATFIGVYVLHIDPLKNGGMLGPLINMWGPWLWYTFVLTVTAGLSIVFMKPCVDATNPLLAASIVVFITFGMTGLVVGLSGDESQSLRIPLNGYAIFLSLVVMLSFSIASWSQAEIYRFTFAASAGALKRLYLPVTVLLSLFFFGKEANLINLISGSTIIFMGAALIGFDKKSS